MISCLAVTSNSLVGVATKPGRMERELQGNKVSHLQVLEVLSPKCLQGILISFQRWLVEMKSNQQALIFTIENVQVQLSVRGLL
jgi:hypothetical protein